MFGGNQYSFQEKSLNMQLIEIAEAQKVDTGQIQQKLELRSWFW
jgi:hypothetical protein